MTEEINEKELTPEELRKKRDDELFKTAFCWRKPVIERLVTQRLLQATVSTDPYIIVENTINAFEMVEAQDQKVEGLGVEKLRIIAKLNLAINNAQEFVTSYKKTLYRVSCPVSPTEDNYKKYFEWWVNSVNYDDCLITYNLKPGYLLVHEIGHDAGWDKFEGKHHPICKVTKENKDELIRKLYADDRCPVCYSSFNSKCFKPDKISRIVYKDALVVDESCFYSLFFEALSCLTTSGYNALKNSFYFEAKQLCGQSIAIMSTLISESVYKDVFKQNQYNKQGPK